MGWEDGVDDGVIMDGGDGGVDGVWGWYGGSMGVTNDHIRVCATTVHRYGIYMYVMAIDRGYI